MRDEEKMNIYVKAFFEGINQFMNMWIGLFYRGLRNNKVWAYSTDYSIQFKHRQIDQRLNQIDKLKSEISDLQDETLQLVKKEPNYQKMHGV